MPGIIHDANAVLGRANRFLSTPRQCDRDLAARRARPRSGARRQGDHRRHADAAGDPRGRRDALCRRPSRTVPLRLLVVGGSQGARVMSDIVPGAIEKLEPALWSRLILTQQVREEDMARVRAVYDRLKINAELAPFFTDLPARLAVQPSGGLALRRGHGGRTRRDRPALDPGAAARRDRSGPVRQCRRAVAGRRRACGSRRPNSPRIGWPPKSRRLPPSRRG